jgi:putative ABC transport system substrate-binding protein
MLDEGRREFITLLGGAAAGGVVSPLAGHAQQPTMPVVGFFTSLGRNDRPTLRDAFRRDLSEAGYVEGRNVAIDYHFAESQFDRLPALAADLASQRPAVIAAHCLKDLEEAGPSTGPVDAGGCSGGSR